VSGQDPLLFYLGIITLITALFTGSLLAKAHAMGAQEWVIALIGLPLLLGASHLAVALVNWLATLLATPRLLPRMDFSGGIPPESRALAVIPTMLTSAQNIEDLVEALEVRFLANRDEHLHFGLLTDFRDAPEETLPGTNRCCGWPKENSGVERKVPRPKSGHVLPLSSSAPLESAGANLDGLRAEAGKACGFEIRFFAAAQGIASPSSLGILPCYRTSSM